jgi:hypothetical protein
VKRRLDTHASRSLALWTRAEVDTLASLSEEAEDLDGVAVARPERMGNARVEFGRLARREHELAVAEDQTETPG